MWIVHQCNQLKERVHLLTDFIHGLATQHWAMMFIKYKAILNTFMLQGLRHNVAHSIGSIKYIYKDVHLLSKDSRSQQRISYWQSMLIHVQSFKYLDIKIFWCSCTMSCPQLHVLLLSVWTQCPTERNIAMSVFVCIVRKGVDVPVSVSVPVGLVQGSATRGSGAACGSLSSLLWLPWA